MKLALAFTAALLAALAFWWFASNDASTPVAAAPTHTLTDTAELDSTDLQTPLESEAAPTSAAETAALESARAEITESAAPEPALAGHPEFARFDLRVVSRDTGKPVPNHRVTLFPDGATVWNGQPGRGNVALPGESARTNARGEATLFATPSPEPLPDFAADAESLQDGNSGTVQLESGAGGRPSRFVAFFGDQQNSPQTPVGPMIVSLDAFHADHRVALEPFGAGERRSVTLEVQVEPDRLVHGLVLDAWTREPLAGAAVWLDSEKAALSDENGAFFVAACSWEHKQFRVDHNDYLSARTPLELGFEDPSQPRAVLMLKRAELEVSVVDALGQPVEARVEARLPEGPLVPGVEHLKAKFWSMDVSPEERAELFDVPAGVELEIRAATQSGLTATHAVRATAGQTPTRVVLRLPEGATISGVLRGFERNRGQTVQLRPSADLHASFFSAGLEASLSVGRSGNVLREPFYGGARGEEVRSDAEGRFVFGNVAQGVWLVTCEDESERSAGASVSVAVTGPQLHEVTLEAQPAAWIHGVVFGPEGRVTPSWVRASAKDGLWRAAAESGADGRFKLGPLPPGEFDLVARNVGGAVFSFDETGRAEFDAESTLTAHARLTIESGANEVELRLQRARMLVYLLVDPSGARLNGFIEIASPGGQSRFATGDDYGHLLIDVDTLRGPVVLRARSSDGRFAGEHNFDPATWTSSTPQTWRLEPVAPPDKR